ncbi:DDE superfamily endonuclease [Popillia japonica]|uniref:DDE superfamily endonuclease n=1 Tax=Popillia japonica TaxID=7064 RepID=A0AAW1JVZ2_POPJA
MPFVENFAREKFATIPVEEEISICNYVNKMVEDYMQKEHLIDDFMDTIEFTANTGESEEDIYDEGLSDKDVNYNKIFILLLNSVPFQEACFYQLLIDLIYLKARYITAYLADRFNISKSTVYNCLSRVCCILNKEAGNFIKWPVGPCAFSIIEGFKKIKSFPGVLGAVDGCHIDIHSTKENSSAYVNRKGGTSMILQGVCDQKCQFTDCFVGFPGSVHNARVFLRSPLFEYCTQDNLFPGNSHLLGDSAYPLKTHILAPFRDNGHLNQNQKIYNTAHAATRSVIDVRTCVWIIKRKMATFKVLGVAQH